MGSTEFSLCFSKSRSFRPDTSERLCRAAGYGSVLVTWDLFSFAPKRGTELETHPIGCGSKLNRWSMFPHTRVPFWYRLFEPQPFQQHILPGCRFWVGNRFWLGSGSPLSVGWGKVDSCGFGTFHNSRAPYPCGAVLDEPISPLGGGGSATWFIENNSKAYISLHKRLSRTESQNGLSAAYFCGL